MDFTESLDQNIAVHGAATVERRVFQKSGIACHRCLISEPCETAHSGVSGKLGAVGNTGESAHDGVVGDPRILPDHRAVLDSRVSRNLGAIKHARIGSDERSRRNLR